MSPPDPCSIFFPSIAFLCTLIYAVVAFDRLTGWLVQRNKEARLFSGSLARLNKIGEREPLVTLGGDHT